jgi:polysaccharide export outer membrane protein
MVWRKPKLIAAGGAQAIIAMVFLAACAAVLNSCNGVPGDGAGFVRQERAPAEDAATAERMANKYVATSTPGNAGYLVGPQDVLDISVYQAPELSKTVQVAENGAMNMPLIGEVRAAGKSPSNIERDIQARLKARYMKSPQVTVFVKEFNSQRVTLEGAVKSPGVFPLRGNETLMQVIAKAGGLDRTVASDNVVVFRSANGVRTMTRFDLAAIRNGGEDPQMLPGDVVVVDDSMAKEGLNYFLRLLPVAGTAAYIF